VHILKLDCAVENSIWYSIAKCQQHEILKSMQLQIKMCLPCYLHFQVHGL